MSKEEIRTALKEGILTEFDDYYQLNKTWIFTNHGIELDKILQLPRNCTLSEANPHGITVTPMNENGAYDSSITTTKGHIQKKIKY